MSARVLILLDTASAWSRGVLRGFAARAHQQGWSVLHYHPGVDVEWLVAKLEPQAAVCGPSMGSTWPKPLEHCVSVAVNHDLSDQGVASVCVDEAAIGQMAMKHLSSLGLKDFGHFSLIFASAQALIAFVGFETWRYGAGQRLESHRFGGG